MNVFEENLKTAMIQSEYALVLKKRKTNTQYQQFEREYHQLFDQNRGLLEPEHRRLLLNNRPAWTRLKGFEPPASSLGGKHSIQLSYKRIQIWKRLIL